MDSSSDDDVLPEPANLRFLRRLVTVLTVVMIFGVLLIVGLLVIRYQRPAPLPLPASITLPGDAIPQAVTYGRDMYLVLSEDNQLFIFDAQTGALRQTLTID